LGKLIKLGGLIFLGKTILVRIGRRKILLGGIRNSQIGRP